MKKNLRTASICVQGGYEPKNGEPIEVPIYQSTTFKYDNSEEMAMLFDLKKEGYFYTRLQNPTNDVVAKKIAELEGGVGAVLTSSGQAANFYAVFNICEAGDHIVTSNEIYGGTFNLFGVTLKKLGIECTFVNPNDSEEEIQKAFRPNTKVVFGETISNPGCAVLDIEKFARIAIWGCYFTQLYVCFFAFPFTKDLGIVCALVCFVLSSISMGIPTNGGLGAWHIAIIFGLSLYGVGTFSINRPDANATAFAMLVWGTQTLLLIALGIYSYVYILMNKTKEGK